MNHSQQYRNPLPPHLQHSQGPHLQPFGGRFPPAGLDGVMIPGLGHEDQVPYHPALQAFHPEHLKKPDRNFALPPSQETLPSSAEGSFQPDSQMLCSHGTKNCLQCYKRGQSRTNKVMVDVATMTDPEEEPQHPSSWPNVTVPPNNKVAEYLSSLRQFLKLSAPGSETKPRKQLGDVRIVNSPDGSRLYCCPECHMAYPDKSLLEPHLASHKIERRFVCGVCGAGLKRKEHLDRHQLSHSDQRPYSCAACPKTFKRNEHLARHYIVHSGEKAQLERRWVCNTCGTGHVRREHLERHQLAHSELRPHICPACHKAFKRSEHLARHLLTHSGLKTHVCLECGKAFYRKDHLRKHSLAHQAKRIRLAGIHCESKIPLLQ